MTVFNTAPQTCRTCGARLRKSRDGHGYNGDETFCSLRCGYEYGMAAATKFVPRRSPLDSQLAHEASRRKA